MPVEVVAIVSFFIGSVVQAWVLSAKLVGIEQGIAELRKDTSAHNAALTHRVNQLEVTVSALVACEKSRLNKKRHPGLPASQA